VTALSFSPAGRVVASSSLDPTIRLWDAATGEPLATLFGHTADINQHAFRPDGGVLLSAGQDSTVRLWQLE
jgi:WD40 repeat protein